ncbi:MAG: type VII toxin-antitoxin system MntA family adenylyltransferase antitoxin [Senegalia sp. (in: firmicutes)]
MDEKLKNSIKRFINHIDNKHEIEFAYLFGSIAKGKENKLSDIDVAVKFKNNYNNMKDMLIRGEIIDSASKFFDKNVDIISLDKASIFLKYEVIKDGIVIKDNLNRATFESLVLREYFDFKYYSDIYNE